MDDFMKFFEYFPMHFEIGYNKPSDWMICIYKQGCADDYQKSKRNGNDAVIVDEQASDMELCFARAHVALKEWLLENEGGY